MENEKEVEKTESVNNNEVDNKEKTTNTNNKPDNTSDKKLLILVGLISVGVLFLLIVCLVVFFNKPKEVVTENKEGGSVSLSYTDKQNTLAIKNATPLEDSVGIKDLTGENYFEFSVETKLEDAREVNYELSISKNISDCTINDSDIKIYLEKEDSGTYTKVFGPDSFKGSKAVTKLGTPKGDMVLTKVNNKKSVTENYRLKIWLSNTASSSTVSQDYSVDINVVGNAK